MLKEPAKKQQYKYYHLSSKDLGEEFTFTPRIPRKPFENEDGDVIEDDFTPRISWARDIEGALQAIPDLGQEFFVYATNDLPGKVDVAAQVQNCPAVKQPGNEYDEGDYFSLKKWKDFASKIEPKVVAPAQTSKRKTPIGLEKCVPDAKDTKEVWATKPVTASCIGIVYRQLGDKILPYDEFQKLQSQGIDYRNRLAHFSQKNETTLRERHSHRKSKAIVNTMQITEERLRALVREELKETVDHETVKTVVTCASKLLKALEAFDKDGTPEMKAALDVSHLLATLENMVNNPASYVPKPNVEPKVVKLRAQKEV